MHSKRSRAVIDAFLPGGDAHPELPGALDVGIEEYLDDFKKSAPLMMWLGFRIAMFLCIWFAPFLIGYFPPITRLPAAAREDALRALANSKSYLLREIVFLVRAVLSFGYGSKDEVRHVIGMKPLEKTNAD